MKKNKLLLIIIFFLLASNKIIKKIYIFKYNKNSENSYTKEKNEITKKNDNQKNFCKILKNNFTEIIINEGSLNGVKVNNICEGENGFIGLVTQVEKNYSIIQTFWHVNWNLVVIDGKNNYGYLKSNGIFLIIKVNENDKNYFIDNENVYITNNNNPPSLLGRVKKLYRNYYKLYPAENIFQIKKVYIKK
jgi:hypothetical protein